MTVRDSRRRAQEQCAHDKYKQWEHVAFFFWKIHILFGNNLLDMMIRGRNVLLIMITLVLFVG